VETLKQDKDLCTPGNTEQKNNFTFWYNI